MADHDKIPVDVPLVQQMGGWSTDEMVLRYTQLSSEHLRTAAERIHDVSLPT